MKQKRSLKNTLTAGGGPQNEFQDRLESYAEKHSLEQQEPQTLKNKLEHCTSKLQYLSTNQHLASLKPPSQCATLTLYSTSIKL